MGETERELTDDDDLTVQEEYILSQFRVRNAGLPAESLDRFDYAVRWFFVSMGAQSGWGVEALNRNIIRAVNMLNSLKQEDDNVVYSETLIKNLRTFMRTAALRIGDCEPNDNLVVPELKQ